MVGGRRALLPRPGAAVNENFDSGQQAFNVMHGSAPAQGDDRSDDTSALQTWLDRAAALGGHRVFVPPGRYRIGRTLVVGSGVTLEGVGANSVLVAADTLVGPLVRIPDGTQGATLRDLVLSGPTPIEVEEGVEGLVIGYGPSGTLDARVFGIAGTTRTLSACSITAGSRVVTCDAGVLTGAEVGWTFEVVGGGAQDSLAAQRGRMNWQGTVESVSVAANTFTATALPPANAGAPDPTAQNPTASGLRAVIGPPADTGVAALAATTAAGGGAVWRFPAGHYVTRYGIQPPSGVTIEGDGQDRTIIHALRRAPGIKVTGQSNVTVRDLTIEAAGPDGDTSGVSNNTGCIDIHNSSHVLVERVTAKYGVTGFSVREAATFDVTLRDCRADEMTKSNGTYGPASTGGIGFWIFNASDVHLDHVVALNCDRHGVFFDPGSVATDPHGFLNRCSGTALHTHNTNREGAGVAIGLGGCVNGEFSDLLVLAAGQIGTPAAGVPWPAYGLTGAWGDVYGLFVGGDQNGEYAHDTTVTGVLLRDIGGVPLSIQGVRTTVRGTKIQSFNLKQVAATPEPAVRFDVYGGFYPANTLAGNDVTDNLVDGLDVLYSGDPTLFNPGVYFSGGLPVPNGSGGTRTSQTLRNRVVNARLVTGTSKPSSVLTSWSGGVNCPSEGADANWAGELSVADQAGSYVRQLAVQAAGQVNARHKQRGDGRLEWGGGTAATDTVLERIASGVLGVTTGQWSAPSRLINVSADGALTVVAGIHALNKAGSACVMTLVAPSSPANDGIEMTITSRTLFAHTVTLGSGSFDNAGAAKDVATFGGAIGDMLVLIAVGPIWYVKVAKNVTFS